MPESYVSNFAVEPQKLTDNSIVYDVVAQNATSRVRINCSDERFANELAATLNSLNVVGFVVDRV